MSKLISIFNVDTSEEVVREMTKDELQEYAIGENSYSDRIAAEAAKLVAKQTVLAKLGLTAEEAEALLA